ncbi:hypothetical protein IFM89_013329 [Coptis chinensis]|nr:hypothetical protein IFM89_013329 [Coptis chinensis]
MEHTKTTATDSSPPLKKNTFAATNICLAVMEGKSAKVITNSPSVFSFEKGMYGADAKFRVHTNPTNTIFGIRRLLGRKFDDPMIQKDMKMVPFKMVRGDNGEAWLEAYGKQFPPICIASLIFSNMKETAESHIGKSVSKAIIAVPGEIVLLNMSSY